MAGVLVVVVVVVVSVAGVFVFVVVVAACSLVRMAAAAVWVIEESDSHCKGKDLMEIDSRYSGSCTQSW